MLGARFRLSGWRCPLLFLFPAEHGADALRAGLAIKSELCDLTDRKRQLTEAFQIFSAIKFQVREKVGIVEIRSCAFQLRHLSQIEIRAGCQPATSRNTGFRRGTSGGLTTRGSLASYNS